MKIYLVNTTEVGMNKLILLSTVFCLTLVLQNHYSNNNSSQSAAGNSSQNIKTDPEKIVKSLFDDYFIPIKNSNETARYISAIKEIIYKYFDIEKISNSVLGPNKEQFNYDQKRVFTSLLIDKMSILYGNQFSEFEDIQNFAITNTETSIRKKDSKKCAIVTSTVIMKGEKIELVWFFLENSNRQMKIIDIKVAGISLTLNWKEQVKSMITQHKEVEKFLENFKN